MSGARPIRLLIVDDVRLMLSRVFTAVDGFEVVGLAITGGEAVELARKLRPDVVLMDVSIPGMNGLEATSLITAEVPGVRVVGLSALPRDEAAERMLAAGGAALASFSRRATRAPRRNSSR